ncbi:unnamed protein product [Mycena citricolor]|uniref:DUF6535 domain-containing protein n=1 Tax=Mycena citricolor TaxID=2018698 RepID=A0AAD2K029_9AGAR|nr:unnamed protein product [Mycena citricolor]
MAKVDKSLQPSMAKADERLPPSMGKSDESFPEREKASGNKLWNTYISEAQNYDQGLVDGWRSEMDGLLIFAGLFSGVVTSFILESYKTLSSDSGTQTLAILNQISQQLAGLKNGTANIDALPPPSAFSPSISSLICNALWFISLALSLSSALVATLIDQWAREYEHRTSMFSSTLIRARVYMYLYYGLQRFNMHAVVGVPPLLLHGALVLFLVGLVVFLAPINLVVTILTSILLLLFVGVYGTFTVLPLFFHDSPYQTPLSRIFWSLYQSLRKRFRAYAQKPVVSDPECSTELSWPPDTPPQTQNMVEAMISAALRSTVDTETRALSWTIRSLSDDNELEPFVEGLTPALWDFEKNEPRRAYQEHFTRLLRDPQVRLCQRLADFMASSHSNLLEPSVCLRRQHSVLQAIWAVCAFCISTKSPMENPIGVLDVKYALLGSRFHDIPSVQELVHAVSALTRLNTIEFWATQPAGGAVENALGRLAIKSIRTEKDRIFTPTFFSATTQSTCEEEKRWAYGQYLIHLSETRDSFQRERTNALFYTLNAVPLLAGKFDRVMVEALETMLGSQAEGTTSNRIFAVRQLICALAVTSPRSRTDIEFHAPNNLASFIVDHPSIARYTPDSLWEPRVEEQYIRYLCECLILNSEHGREPQATIDSLRLIYHHLNDKKFYAESSEDLDAHLLTLWAVRNYGAQAASVRRHHAIALVQTVAVCCVPESIWESARGLDIFEDEDWFRTALHVDDDAKWVETAVPREETNSVADFIRCCAALGVVTTFLEQCVKNPDEAELELDFDTLTCIISRFDSDFDTSRSWPDVAVPPEIQRRFTESVSAFLVRYPTEGPAENSVLAWLLTVSSGMSDPVALQVRDRALFDKQKD